MSSVQKCADRLQEQAHKILTPQVQALEDELQDVSRLLAARIRSIGYKLEALRHTELPAAEPVLNDFLRDDIQKRDLESEMLALFTRGLRTKETQEEILTSLLDSAVNCFPRVALFAARGGMFKGWSSRGFSDSTAGIISSDCFRQADCPLLMEVLQNGDQAESAGLPDTGSLRLMREESSGAWRLYPLHVLGRPAAILLAGEADGSGGRPRALAALMDCAALRLENVALKIIQTLTASAPANADAGVFAGKSLHETSSAEYAGESEPVEEIPASEPSEPAPAAPPQPVTNPEAEQLHAASRRFAELLVSEIMLYNEDAVAEGRKNRDLYGRLMGEMNRSREMYEKRVAPTVAGRVDYLHDEFVRILGDGDAGAFGDGYPGAHIREQTGL